MSIRPPQRPASSKHFTGFHSAAEEVLAARERESWDNEGGHTGPFAVASFARRALAFRSKPS
jgi:hypothetical protein